GVTAALTGSLFGSALQRPAVLAAIALALVGLAGSNFGLYQLRVPSPLVQRFGRVGEEEERQHRRPDARRRDHAHGEAHEEGAQVALADAAEALHDRRRDAQLIEAEVAPREADERERDRGQDRGSLERRAEERAGERRRHAG